MGLHPLSMLVVAVLVFLLIRAEFAGYRRMIYRIKPLCSLSVVLLAGLSYFTPGGIATYTAGIMGGLLLSFGGDMALMFPAKRAFSIGLALFLLAHVVYAIVLTVPIGYAPTDLWGAAVAVVISAVVYAYLFPGLGSMKGPVLAYVVVIGFMVHRATATFGTDYFTPAQAWIVTIGAGLFYLSDVILAVNKFRRPFKHNRISLAFYYAGQMCLAVSAGMFPAGV
ncbi:MAG: hypothetical protein GF344_12350 [Chitinivibrionales bacterium]|nr:hypothetical protein [Chitinivibrionales bacterium]